MNEIIKNYWENRYKSGDNSGIGSYGICCYNKIQVINNYIKKFNVKSVADFGCGDGHISGLIDGYENYYAYDISEYTINRCREKYKEKTNMFFHTDINELPNADMCLSLDVLYHIVDDETYGEYLSHLFNKSKKYVLIFSTNYDDMHHKYYGDRKSVIHMYHRIFTDWIDRDYKNFKLVEKLGDIPTTTAEFYLYEKI